MDLLESQIFEALVALLLTSMAGITHLIGRALLKNTRSMRHRAAANGQLYVLKHSI